MIVIVLDIIFKGKFSTTNFNFLKELLVKANEVRFNSPETLVVDTYETVVEVFHSNSYADLVITTDSLVINEVNVPHVFINLTRDGNEVELLFYFDLKDLGIDSYKNKFDTLKNWTLAFNATYGFDYFVCQMDNGNEEEYYFDSNGPGPLYNVIEAG